MRYQNTTHMTGLLIAILLLLLLAACGNSDMQKLPSEQQSDGNHGINADETGITEESPALGVDAHILIAYFTAAENSDVDAVASASVVMTDGFTVSERNVADAAKDVADWLDGLGS